MDTKLVSACLLGVECAYHGGSNRSDGVCAQLSQANLIPICPEQLGGLATPREKATIVGGDGADVHDGRAKVLTQTGCDVTPQYIKGGQEALKIARQYGVKEAIMKAFSPSCGCGEISTEDLKDKKSGDGTTTALLKRNGIRVLTELDFAESSRI